ncbi:MAG: sigma-70 family RNA polymerase sigma factor [Planctomycetes bacterium]|nr:sigma-70 family RNA polymerase sigma factor [Planctomycetota bacterium]
MPTRMERSEFERLVREHHARVHRAARRAARDDAEALDAVSEVFRRLLEGRIPAREARDPGALLACAAVHEVLAARRSETSRARREADIAMGRTESRREDEVERRELEALLARELSELPDELRGAVVLRCTEEFGYAEIGSALGIGASTAHERVQRGLERLRERLAHLGYAFSAGAVAGSLRELEAPRTPADLEARLCALRSSPWISAAAAPSLLVGAAVFVAGAVALVLVRRHEAPPHPAEIARAADAPRDREPLTAFDAEAGNDASSGLRAAIAPVVDEGRPDVGPAGRTAPAPLAPAHLAGRVVDVLGLAVEGARVRAASAAREGKFPVSSVEAVTDAHGVFALVLPVGTPAGEEYAITVDTGTLRHTDEPARVRPALVLPTRRIQLPEEVLDRPGVWTLAVVVRDPRGAPVPGALVHALRPVQSGGASWLEREDGAQADASGRAELAGTRLGPKLVRVDARAAGFAIHEQRRTLDAPDRTELEVQLAPGAEIVLRVLDESGRPAAEAAVGEPAVQLHAFDGDPNHWLPAEVQDSEHARIPALAARPHTLRFHSATHSAFTLEGVVPGGAPIEVRLKRRTDPRPGGTHDAEIHGRIVESAGRTPVLLDFLDVVVRPIEDGSPGLLDGDFWPLFAARSRAQVSLGFGGEPPPRTHTFAFDGLAPGRYLVAVTVPGHAPTCAGPIELGARELTGPIEISVDRGARIEGRVLDERGDPLDGAWVLLTGAGELSRRDLAEADRELSASGGRGPGPSGAVRARPGGVFALPHVPCDRALWLIALHPAREPGPPFPLRVTKGGLQQVDLTAGRMRER